MMTSSKAPSLTEHLGRTFAAKLQSASQERDVEKLMSYYSLEATLTDVVNGHSVAGWNAIRDYYAAAYQQMPDFKIEPTKTTVADNCIIGEMKCQGNIMTKPSEDGQSTAITINMVGVTLLWCKWEGEHSEWDGGLSDSSLPGWKIVEERMYVMRS